MIPFETPILFLVFNRMDTTVRVFEAIKHMKPIRLYIACDGARKSVEGEREEVEKIRKYLLKNITWQCELKTLFREQNLGCRLAVSSAIDWFFENEEQGIILEDDCLPAQGFFSYCEELLTRYKNDLRVGQVSGFNHGYHDDSLNYSYHFSKYNMIWGWATWRDRWLNYSLEMADLDEILSNRQLSLLFTTSECKRREGLLKKTHAGNIDTWDYQWYFTLCKNNQLTIIPKHTYIKNIGFGEMATHTTGSDIYANIVLFENDNELKHPPYLIQLPNYCKLINKKQSLSTRIRMKLFKK